MSSGLVDWRDVFCMYLSPYKKKKHDESLCGLLRHKILCVLFMFVVRASEKVSVSYSMHTHFYCTKAGLA